MITNPILPGFHSDPCICRKGDDYYLAVSSFEWLPGIPIYHSRDLKNWELYSHVITEKSGVDLTRLPSAKEMKGPWSKPVYLHSSGFDASLFHDRDGRKWLVSLEWETREGYEKPGAICMVEYDPQAQKIIGYPRRIWHGGTDRGCIEAPHLTRRGDYYYIMCAEGGTGYNHCVTMGRSKNVWGPYEKDPMNPILTSTPGESYERHNPDHLKPKYYNPESILQKSGHGSYVETQTGEVYMVHLTARPFVPELRCTLGRETAIQKMEWTEDQWLRLEGGGNLARKLRSLRGRITTKMEFIPEIHQHSAGLILYYDNMNYVNLRKYYSETLGQSALSIVHLENGQKTELLNSRIPVDDVPIYLRLYIEGRESWFEWSYDGTSYQKIGKTFDTTKFSDEYCEYGEFTGTMVGLTCADRVKHEHCADFDFLEYISE